MISKRANPLKVSVFFAAFYFYCNKRFSFLYDKIDFTVTIQPIIQMESVYSGRIGQIRSYCRFIKPTPELMILHVQEFQDSGQELLYYRHRSADQAFFDSLKPGLNKGSITQNLDEAAFILYTFF